MRFDTHYIRAFQMVAEELHFRRAAERLHLTQPALSRIINALEDQVGVALLERTTRSVELTEAGRYFLEESRLALQHLHNAVQMARNAAEGGLGQVRVAYMDFAINGELPRILKECKKYFPGIKIELSYMPTRDQRSAIVDGEVDIAFMIGPFVAQNIDSLVVEKQRLVVLLSEFHPLVQKESLDLTDIVDEPFVLGAPQGWQTFRDRVFDLFHRYGATPRIAQEAATSDGIFGLVAANVGITLYTDCIRNIRRKGLTYRYLSENHIVQTIAAWNRGRTKPSTQKLIELISGYYAVPP